MQLLVLTFYELLWGVRVTLTNCDLYMQIDEQTDRANCAIWQLAKKAAQCPEYIVVHELVHLLER